MANAPVSSERVHVTIEHGAIHINAESQPLTVDVGCNQPVVIDKMFGPLIFADIRATADFKTGEWVIERRRIDSMEWIEVARVPGQMDCEFDESHQDHREIPST